VFLDSIFYLLSLQLYNVAPGGGSSSTADGAPPASNVPGQPSLDVLARVYPTADISGWLAANNGKINNETLWVKDFSLENLFLTIFCRFLNTMALQPSLSSS
jgi:hypothetical protein